MIYFRQSQQHNITHKFRWTIRHKTKLIQSMFHSSVQCIQIGRRRLGGSSTSKRISSFTHVMVDLMIGPKSTKLHSRDANVLVHSQLDLKLNFPLCCDGIPKQISSTAERVFAYTFVTMPCLNASDIHTLFITRYSRTHLVHSFWKRLATFVCVCVVWLESFWSPYDWCTCDGTM